MKSQKFTVIFGCDGQIRIYHVDSLGPVDAVDKAKEMDANDYHAHTWRDDEPIAVFVGHIVDISAT